MMINTHKVHTLCLMILCTSGFCPLIFGHYEISLNSLNITREQTNHWPDYIDPCLNSVLSESKQLSSVIGYFILILKVLNAFCTSILVPDTPNYYPTLHKTPPCPKWGVVSTQAEAIHRGVLKRPTGHAEYYHPPHCPKILGPKNKPTSGYQYGDPEATAQRPTWTWEIYLDPRLRLNVTFKFIYFSVVKPCQDGSLMITRTKTFPSCMTETAARFQNISFFFSGIYSQISLFPPDTCVAITACANMYVVHDIFLVYATIMSSSIVSLVSTQSEQAFLVQASDVLQSTPLICVYHIITRKIHRIHIQVQPPAANDVQVYDGPGSLSRTAKLLQHSPYTNTKKYLTTTFQCVVFVSCDRNPENNSESSNIKVHFTQKHGKYQKAILNQNERYNFSFPSPVVRCFPFCMLKIQTQAGFNTNITTTHMTYSGKINTMDCRFGGIGAFHALMEISNLCVKTSNISEESRTGLPVRDEYIFPNIYSVSDEMTLVIFSYPEYAEMTTTFTAATMKCKHILIHTVDKEGQKTVLPFQPPFQKEPNVFLQLHQNSCLVLQLDINQLATVQHTHGPDDVVGKSREIWALLLGQGSRLWLRFEYILRVAVNQSEGWNDLIKFRLTSFFRGIYFSFTNNFRALRL